MVRRTLSALLGLLAVFALPEHGTMQSRAAIAGDLAERAAAQPVRVIVRVRAPRIAGDASSPGVMASQKAVIASAQDGVLSRAARSLSDVKRFETLPGFSTTTDFAGLTDLASIPDVVAIEEDRILRPFLVDSPRIIGADVLWQQGVEGSGWSVAVLDDGVLTTHPFIRRSVIAEACFSTTSLPDNTVSLCAGGRSSVIGPGAAMACEDCTHGTQVAGIAVGQERELTIGGERVSGIARKANLIAIQVFSREVGGDVRAYTSDVIRGLEHVLTLAGAGNSASIAAVNLSLGEAERHYSAACDSDNTLFTEAVNKLRSIGIATVIASGNDGLRGELSFPACISRAVSVGSVDKNDQISAFTNRSARLNLVAPGQVIRTSNNGDPLFTFSNGTSMSAPHVAGAWALLKSRSPNSTVDQILGLLQQTGRRITDTASGLTFSRIQVDRASLALGSTSAGPTNINVQVFGSTVTATWDPPSNGTAPSSYFVEISLVPNGPTVAAVNVGGDRVYATTLPNGTYALRVRAFSASGSGVTSNDIPFQVGPTPNSSAPNAPRDLRIDYFNNVVTLTWNRAPGGPDPETYIIDVGSAPSLSNLGSFDTGSSARTLVATPPLAGTYFVRVRARNAFGASNASSNEAVLTVGGGASCTAPPSAPAGVSATVVGSLVTLNWGQPLTSGPITGYLLEAGTAPGRADTAQAPLGVTTVVSGVAGPGTYYVRVRARNACGLSAPSGDVMVVVG